MVKNKHGGNRHKKMASKNAKPQSFNRRVRFADKSGSEIYAKVERVYGGNRALVICNDGQERLMEWRRKFSGRNKRDNFIGGGRRRRRRRKSQRGGEHHEDHKEGASGDGDGDDEVKMGGRRRKRRKSRRKSRKSKKSRRKRRKSRKKSRRRRRR